MQDNALPKGLRTYVETEILSVANPDADLRHLAAIVRNSDDVIMGKTVEGIIST
jgi:hypothetical protein